VVSEAPYVPNPDFEKDYTELETIAEGENCIVVKVVRKDNPQG